MDFRNTLHLPDAEFTIPMKADLPKLEPRIQDKWNSEAIYERLQELRKAAPSYVLHDGPPYTNSPIHIGTALNKVLKDFVVKSRTMMGFRAPYVPGFDNHGLPIEQSVMKKFHEKKVQPTITQLRQACREHATEYLKVQSDQFRRLGVFGMWDRPYATMDFGFEAEIIRVFKRLVEGGYVYKGLRPTLWSPTSRTALADTEIVYQDHTSTAIYVRFPLKHDPNGFSKGLPNFYTIIWTTTPWTIPSNLAVAFNPQSEYAVVKVTEVNGSPLPAPDHYLVAHELVARLAEALGWTNSEILYVDLGVSFENATFSHPIFGRDSLAVMADYVTMEDGTGVVHTAPSHGRDDFFTGLKYKLPVPNTVDERGVLTEEAGEFAGTYYKDCDTVVVERLREVGALLDARPYQHSYPHAERDGQPVIFRATEQWFISMEHDGLRQKMLNQIGHVSWVPGTGQNRIEAMVRNRPDWCISRQRPWGVGIPVFYGAQTRTPVLDPVAIEAVAQLVEQEGSDAWFEKDARDILPSGYTHPETGETEFVKETDVLDVWFDSGATSLCVLEGNVEPRWREKWPADLYLEGSDQHRGWFNTSLIIGTAIHGHAPYRQVLTHGFVTDEKGLKMSKRLGNVVDPVEASERLGADIVRYWVASVDYTNDAPCSENLLKVFGENYRSVRNTFRFLLGNLKGFDGSRDMELLPLDEWAVEQADLLVADVVGAYERFDFDTAIRGVHDFCVSQLSRFYLDAIKDRMYCDATDSPSRRSGQIACFEILTRLVKLVAPVLVHTAEEVWQRLVDLNLVAKGELNSIHAQNFELPSEERMAAIEGSALQQRFATVLGVRENVFAAFETWKGTDDVKDSQDAVATIAEDAGTVETLRSFDPSELATLMKMSWVEIEVSSEDAVSFAKSGYAKCERCRLRRPTVQQRGEALLCERCDEVVRSLS